MKKLTSLLIILGIGAAVSLGSAKEETINLVGKTYTAKEYADIKVAVTSKVTSHKIVPISYEDVAIWQAIFNKENAKCRFVMNDVTEENLIEKANEALINGC